MTLNLSIIIVNWNTKDLLKECRKSIYKETKDISYEILVVDNASSDGSSGIIKTEFPEVRLIRNRENLGFARANNQAFRLSQGRYVLLLNPDTVILNRAINRMVEFMDKHPGAGLAGGKLLNPDLTLQPSCVNFPSILNLIKDNLFRLRIFPPTFSGRYVYRLWAHNEIREVDWLLGAFMMVRREVIHQTGGFDEDYFLYGEDMDWCYRIKEKGWQVLFYPEARVIHLGRKETPTKGDVGWIERVYKANFLFYKKHYGLLRLILYRIIASGVLLSRVFLYGLSQPLGGKGARKKREQSWHSLLVSLGFKRA